MKKLLGITGILVFVCVFTSLNSERFLTTENVEELVHRTAVFGILSIGAAFVIITGGIDLSIGSMICLVGCLFPWLIREQEWPVAGALVAVLALASALGLVHGLLITRLKLQPFIVTLCGLLLYRGVTRGITEDQTQGFKRDHESLRTISTERVDIIGDFSLPYTFVVMAVIAVAASILLRRTVWGRYLFALGRNEEAARFSGVNTARMTCLAYVICSFLAGVAGLLFMLDVNSVSASSFGNFYELYAIAGAVLGGCALRGGEGAVLGVIIGASIMQVLRNAIRFVEFIPNQLEFAIIGAVILAGVVVDELVKRFVAARR